MKIPISSIVIDERIRKDFGNIKELADDIKQNGLINPPVVNQDYKLLAGERRLRACKSLGWKEIEVRVMDTRDAEHELNVEISENENRKEFSKSERADYMMRLMRIESAKAKERQSAGGGSGKSGRQKSVEPRKADEATAEQFGISRDTLRKELAIVDHKDMLSLEDFADWDEGKLSTNKAYQKIKAKLQEVEGKLEKVSKSKSNSTQFYMDRIAQLEAEKKALEGIAAGADDVNYQALLKDKETLQRQLNQSQENLKAAHNRIAAIKAKQGQPRSHTNFEELEANMPDMTVTEEDLAKAHAENRQLRERIKQQNEKIERDAKKLEKFKLDNERLKKAADPSFVDLGGTNRILTALSHLNQTVKEHILPLKYDRDFANLSDSMMGRVRDDLTNAINALNDVLVESQSGSYIDVIDGTIE